VVDSSTISTYHPDSTALCLLYKDHFLAYSE
jgi:hypothetical protein